jgi:hypothetical protein
MIDDLVNGNYGGLTIGYLQKRAAATVAALELCPENIRDWLILCTAYEKEPDVAYSNADVYNSDGVEWFDVGHNSTHYFSFGIRPDGVFVAKSCGPEYSEECQCWYDSTTISVVTPENVCNRYWGHM